MKYEFNGLSLEDLKSLLNDTLKSSDGSADDKDFIKALSNEIVQLEKLLSK